MWKSCLTVAVQKVFLFVMFGQCWLNHLLAVVLQLVHGCLSLSLTLAGGTAPVSREIK